MVHFNLHVEQGDTPEGEALLSVIFRLAFQHEGPVGSSSGSPLWFMVDSILQQEHENVSADTPSLGQLGKTLKRQISFPKACSKQPSAKRVRFDAHS